jgi:O-antigen ligase
LVELSLYINLPRSRNPLPFRGIFGTYFFAVLLSTFQASVPEAALFYPFQLARIFLLFALVARACSADDRVAPSLLRGMAIGICAEACIVIWQRFALGELQAGGTFIHQNGLGLVSHFVVFPYFALLLAGKRGWEAPVVVVAGILAALLTVSRATLGLAALGYAILFAISSLRKWTFRKAVLAGVGAVSIALLLPLALSFLDNRFAASPVLDDYDERAAFEMAAAAILSDHPMGIGANNYVVAANTQGYNERAGVAASQGSLSANVHNVYRLVAAETGYFGLLTFVALLLQPLIVAFVWGWRNRGDIRGDLLLGLGVSLMIFYLHSFFEWTFVVFYIQYFFAISVGLVAGLAQQLGYRSRLTRSVKSLSSAPRAT